MFGAGLDCGILFCTYDLLISTKRLSATEKAAVATAEAQAQLAMRREEIRDDINPDEILFGALTCTTKTLAWDSHQWVSEVQPVRRQPPE